MRYSLALAIVLGLDRAHYYGLATGIPSHTLFSTAIASRSFHCKRPRPCFEAFLYVLIEHDDVDLTASRHHVYW